MNLNWPCFQKHLFQLQELLILTLKSPEVNAPEVSIYVTVNNGNKKNKCLPESLWLKCLVTFSLWRAYVFCWSDLFGCSLLWWINSLSARHTIFPQCKDPPLYPCCKKEIKKSCCLGNQEVDSAAAGMLPTLTYTLQRLHNIFTTVWFYSCLHTHTHTLEVGLERRMSLTCYEINELSTESYTKNYSSSSLEENNSHRTHFHG